MTGNRKRTVQPFTILLVFLATAGPLFGAVRPGDDVKPVAFEARLASFEDVEGWQGVAGPKPDQTIWISPEATLTNADVANAWPERMGGEVCIGLLLTEAGALKLAELTKAHVGEPMALMVDGRVTAVPRIAAPITGGRAILQGNFTEEEAQAIAAGIVGE
jgi:preprotein translocase subunit SecD